MLANRESLLLRRRDDDMGLGREHAVEDVGLYAREQRGHEDDDRDADRGPDDGEKRLPPALDEEAEGSDDLEGQERAHFSIAFSMTPCSWPEAAAEPAGATT